MYGARGHGLRGGSFAASGAYYSHAPVTLRMRGTRFVSDVAVSGRAVWDRRAGTVSARLRVRGPRSGRLRIRWRTRDVRSVASLRGRLGGRPCALQHAGAVGVADAALSESSRSRHRIRSATRATWQLLSVVSEDAEFTR